MSDLVRLVVVDDHRLIHGVLMNLLESDGFEIVGTARKGSEVLPLVGRELPDAVLLELDLPELDGIGVINRLHDRFPDVKPVILAQSARPEEVAAALDAGAFAYISKAVDPSLLAATIHRALKQPIAEPIGIPDTPKLGGLAARLTERERGILRLLAEGGSNAQIGAQLFVTEQTVKFHLTNIYRKIGVPNRTTAAAAARQLGLVDLFERVA